MKAVAYIAHPLGNGADRERNRANAQKWCAWCAEHLNVSPVADWILLSGEWTEDKRELGLACDLAVIPRCDVIILCGGRVSPGMNIEREMARSHLLKEWDLTSLGYEPPRCVNERQQQRMKGTGT